jgi:hypothetical protein
MFHPASTCHTRPNMRFQARHSGRALMADNKNKTPFYLIDTQSQFYKPVGVRAAICASVIFWAVLETWHQQPFWAVISVALAVYCIYVLFWSYTLPADVPPPPVRPNDDEEDEESKDVDSDEKPKP